MNTSKPFTSRAYRTVKSRAEVLIYLLLAFLVLFSLLKPGYILTLDMVFTPQGRPLRDLLYGFELSSRGGVLPVLGILELSSYVFPMWLIQKILLAGILFVSGLSAHYMMSKEGKWASYFAGFIYMINPFTYVRFLAGQWLILAAYCLIPLAFIAYRNLLKQPTPKNILFLGIVASLIAWFNIQILILTGILFASLTVWYMVFEGRRFLFIIWKPLGLAFLLLTFLNFFWVAPAAMNWGGTTFSALGPEDLRIFSLDGDGLDGTVAAMAMYGFWKEGYIYVKDIFPLWPLLLFILLLLVSLGAASRFRNPVTLAMITTTALVLFLAPGLSGPLGDSYEVMYNNIPLLKGFRDTHKFVALLPLAYAYLGGLGVREIAKQLQKQPTFQRRTLYLSILTLLIASPFFYSYTMFNFYGQLKPSDYPEDWYQAERMLKSDPEDFNVLFLPWHLYMNYDWLSNRDKRLASPAKLFFSKPVIGPLNIERGSNTLDSKNPAQIYLTNLFNNPSDVSNFSLELQLLGVKYVLLAKETDYQLYDFLYIDKDLQIVQDSETLAVFKNLKPVASAYRVSDTGNLSGLEPVNSIKNSAVSFKISSDLGSDLLFVPENLDGSRWDVSGGSKIPEPDSFFILINPASEELDLTYKPFIVQVASYGISLSCLVALVLLSLTGFIKRRLANRNLLFKGDSIHNL
jgi:hypothetical protein